MSGVVKKLAGGIKDGLRQPFLSAGRRAGKLVRPMFLDFAVTWRCNARCVMCDTWQTYKDLDTAPPQELTLAELEAIFSRDADFLRDLRKFGLTGGEPFLRSDLVELVELLSRKFPRAAISLVSNGLMTKRILAALARIREFRPDLSFSVSLDGIGDVHDRVRGIPGAYDKALATIKGALDLGFTVTSGATIGRHNFDQIPALSQMLGRMGVDFSCNLQERGENFHNDGAADELSQPERDRIVQDLAGFRHHYYMDHVRRQLLGEERTLPCYAGYTSYFLTPTGDVAYCNLIGDPLGNLRRQSFAEIAGSSLAWLKRRELAACTCWSQCEVKNSAASAPWHVVKWFLTSPAKRGFLQKHLGKQD